MKGIPSPQKAGDFLLQVCVKPPLHFFAPRITRFAQPRRKVFPAFALQAYHMYGSPQVCVLYGLYHLHGLRIIGFVLPVPPLHIILQLCQYSAPLGPARRLYARYPDCVHPVCRGRAAGLNRVHHHRRIVKHGLHLLHPLAPRVHVQRHSPQPPELLFCQVLFLLMASCFSVSSVPFIGDCFDRLAHIKAAVCHRICVNACFQSAICAYNRKFRYCNYSVQFTKHYFSTAMWAIF
nr:MAG TPA: hypothetical protein [Caudoviricetes sp.]